MRPTFTLIPDGVSHETLRALEQLREMAMAKRRRLIGIAFGAMVLGPDGRHYFTNAAGELYRNPTFARGVIAELDDALGELARGQVPYGWQ